MEPEQYPITQEDCVGCGVCCASFRMVKVDGRHRTPSHLTELLPGTMRNTITGAVTPARVMRKHDGLTACIALMGQLGEDAHCTIYDQRPQVCRDFEPGSEQCLAARELYRKNGVLK